MVVCLDGFFVWLGVLFVFGFLFCFLWFFVVVWFGVFLGGGRAVELEWGILGLRSNIATICKRFLPLQ